MANQQGNGRKAAMPDDNRPSWRPQDETGARGRRLAADSEDRERVYASDRDDEYRRDRERLGSYWDERSRRWDPDEDRSYSSRDLGYPGEFEDRPHERGFDERWSHGRGGPRWVERDEGYGRYGSRGMESERSVHGRDYGARGMAADYGESGRTHGSPPIGAAAAGWDQQRMYPGSRYPGYESPYREPGMQSREGMIEQSRYGSQGYQGWGQQDQDWDQNWRPQGRSGRQRGRPGHGAISHRGKGPSSYTRSDERIREIVCEALTEDHNVDATNIEVTVKNADVTLSGTVEDRMQKRMAEDCVEQIAGVRDIQNQIRIGGDKRASGKEAESSTNQDKRSRA